MMDADEIIRAGEEQGWRRQETTHGYMIYPPDRTQSGVLFHRQPTEQALKKTLSQMRQRGLVWPPPEGKPEGNE